MTHLVADLVSSQHAKHTFIIAMANSSFLSKIHLTYLLTFLIAGRSPSKQTVIDQSLFIMTTAAVFGSTGAVGSQILAALLSSDAFSSVQTVSRRRPGAQSSKLQAIEEGDPSKWGGMISSLSPEPSTVFNAVGTTRAAAGGLQNQWKIDHDLCAENARAAKEAGVKTYVFVSAGGTRGFISRWVPYSKMKIGVEDTIRDQGFEHAVILRPGLITGRESPKAAWLEYFVENFVPRIIRDRISMSVLIRICVCTHTDVYVQARIREPLAGRLWQLPEWQRRERRLRSIGYLNRLIS